MYSAAAWSHGTRRSNVPELLVPLGNQSDDAGALADIANAAERVRVLDPGDAVLDIGCNHGTLLASYKAPGIYRIGFDPAENLAVFSRKVADRVIKGFFASEQFRRIPT